MTSKLNVDHFKSLVIDETARFEQACSKWRKIADESENKDVSITEDILGDINAAVGLAVLLKNQRFNQFNKLIEQCENKSGEKEITCQDLQGFWDIIYIQVENIHSKFSTLEKLQSNNWEKEKLFEPIRPVLKKKVLSNIINKPKVEIKSNKSNLKAHILAARKQMQQKKQGCIDGVVEKITDLKIKDKENREIPTTTESSTTSPEVKNFDAIFFKVVTPHRNTPTRMKRSLSPSDNIQRKFLSSSALKEHFRKTPPVHKDYMSCMRITRSMKKKLDNDCID